MWAGCLYGSQMWGEGAEKGLPVSPKVCGGGWGWGCRMKLYFPVEPGRRASGGGVVTCRGRPGGEVRGSGAGPREEGPRRPPRAPLGPAWASREAAWRRAAAAAAAAPPRSRPTFKSKWLKPRALGGRRDPAPLRSGPKAAVPTETLEVGSGAGTPSQPGKAYGGGRRGGAHGVGASSLGHRGTDVGRPD